MSAIVDIEPLMRGLYEEMQMGGETYSTQSVYEMIEKETSKVEIFTKADMLAMLTDLLIDVEEIESREQWCDYANDNCISRYDVEDLIQQKINALKGE